MLASMLRVAAAGYDDHAVAQPTGLDPSPPRSPASTQAPSSARPSPPTPALICEATVRTQNHHFGAAQTVARPTGNVDQIGGYFARPGGCSWRAAGPRSDRLPPFIESRSVSLVRGCRSITAAVDLEIGQEFLAKERCRKSPSCDRIGMPPTPGWDQFRNFRCLEWRRALSLSAWSEARGRGGRGVRPGRCGPTVLHGRNSSSRRLSRRAGPGWTWAGTGPAGGP